jgi:hypothetical protein
MHAGALQRHIELPARLRRILDVTRDGMREDEVVRDAWKWRPSSPAKRSAIGTDRPRWFLGDSNAPRTYASATRTRGERPRRHERVVDPEGFAG